MIEVEADRIKSIAVKRGAPCGATWDVLARVIGLPVQEAIDNPGTGSPVYLLC